MSHRFNTVEDMLKYLSQYRHAYYMEIALEAQLTTIHSPSFDGLPADNHTETAERWNEKIQRKDEYNQLMESIREDIKLLYDPFDSISYTIMWHKFVDFKTLEEIALMTHYSLSHIKNKLYPKAKLDLFRLLTDDSTK